GRAMNNKSSCNLAARWPRSGALVALALLLFLLAHPPAARADAPQWMHALVNAPLPAHDEKTDAVLLYSEEILSVQSSGKMKKTLRQAYKILRPGGRKFGQGGEDFDSETKVNYIHAWCIPAQGKDYEVKDKEAIETALLGVQNGELLTDIRSKLMTIPAA